MKVSRLLVLALSLLSISVFAAPSESEIVQSYNNRVSGEMGESNDPTKGICHGTGADFDNGAVGNSESANSIDG